MIQAQVYYRVFHVVGERGLLGTAFLIDVDEQQYLATARHLLNDDREEEINLRHAYMNDGETTTDVMQRVGALDAPADVALLKPSIRLLEVMEAEAASNGLMFTQDVFILGFPHGLALQLDKSQPGRNLPLAKRGILAGSQHTPQGHMFFVDAIANPGFSGGPMVFHRGGHQNGPLCLGGIVKGSFSQSVEGSEERTAAGLTAVTDIAEALALLP